MTLKAYQIQDGDEGYGCVVFATNSATARREGANELNADWSDIESCRRAPHFDRYAPGPVPPMTLIEHGWWFECQHCGRRVSDGMTEELEDDGLDPADFVPRPAGSHGVFCSESCECADYMAQQGREEAADALREVFEAKFTDAEITHVHASSGPKLEVKTDRGGRSFVVTFKFPGSQYTSQWDFGGNFWVPRCDHDAFFAWQGVSAGDEREGV